ncbi:hypothetical protein TomTYG75_27610 [Sphingobium sp. TomTYG75]
MKDAERLFNVLCGKDGKFLIDQEFAHIHADQSLVFDDEDDNGPWEAGPASQSCHFEPSVRFHAIPTVFEQRLWGAVSPSQDRKDES